MARSTGARLRILCVLTLKKQTSGFQKVFSGRLQLGCPFHHILVLLSWIATLVALVCSALSAIWLIYRRRFVVGISLLVLAAILWFGLAWIGQTTWGDEFAAWYLD
jgi:hypothetical protein